MTRSLVSRVGGLLLLAGCASVEVVSAQVQPLVVLDRGRLLPSAAVGMGVADGANHQGWLVEAPGALRLDYPGGLGWGAVFITAGGDPAPGPKPGADLSAYRTLVVEMRAEGGDACVEVGMKDTDDPDDGTEPKVAQSLGPEWQTFRYPIRDRFLAPRRPSRSPFDPTKVYVLAEFVFPCGADGAATVLLRNVVFEP